MISNTPYKIRASKSSRDVHDSDDTSYNSLDEDTDDCNRRNNSYLKDVKYSKGVGRSRSTEFRSSRVNERRGYRGRGSSGLSSSNRKSDREFSDGWNLRKYDSRNNETLGMNCTVVKSLIYLNTPIISHIKSKRFQLKSVENLGSHFMSAILNYLTRNMR